MTDKPFFCPRGVKTVEEHTQQYLTHRWIPGRGVACMDVGAAFKYDQTFPPFDTRRRAEPIPLRSTSGRADTFTLAGSYRYDVEMGELQEMQQGMVREVIKVREELRGRIFRQAVILELEKLGYTVISPESTEE